MFFDGDKIQQVDFYMRDAKMPPYTKPPTLPEVEIGSLCLGEEKEEEQKEEDEDEEKKKYS